MPIQSRANQYQGVNAHLYSHFQNYGGWSSFHTNHITDLDKAINDQLPVGYIVDIEQSLQIHEFHPDTGERIRHPELDMTNYHSASESAPAQRGQSTGIATFTRPIIETIEFTEDAYYSAVVIYEMRDDSTLGRPVTRLELLSPSNKYDYGYIQYREKRNIALQTNLCLVEIDYLHQRPSPVKGIPIYPLHPNAYPYNIAISNPNLSLEEGFATIFAFHVDDMIPTIDIPLVGEDVITINLNDIYNLTFASLAAYSLRVDYEALPDHFESYSPEDQKRIKQRLNTVQAAFEQGLNLEEGPFPIRTEP